MIHEKSFGSHHPKVAIDLNNLGVLLNDTNRSEEAEPIMRRALAIDEKSFGPDHPRIALRLCNLARLLKNKNRLEEVEPLLRRRLEIFLKLTYATGNRHPSLDAALEGYDDLLEAMGQSYDQILAQLDVICKPYGIQSYKCS